MLQEPCSTPLMKPRERIGHCSIASAAPAGHSAPMPMPSSVRNTSRNMKLGEKPAMKLQIEYQKIEIISGVLRPMRSASQPEATAPTSRIHKVSVKTIATSVVGTPNSSAIGLMISRKTVKSNASSVQPRRPPRIPLILGGFAPPRDLPCIDRRHPAPLHSVGPFRRALPSL